MYNTVNMGGALTIEDNANSFQVLLRLTSDFGFEVRSTPPSGLQQTCYYYLGYRHLDKLSEVTPTLSSLPELEGYVTTHMTDILREHLLG